MGFTKLTDKRSCSRCNGFEKETKVSKKERKMEDNYTIVKFVKIDKIDARRMRIFNEMIDILQHKFGNINKNDCYWLINQENFYKICEICSMMDFDFELDIECNKNRVSINGIDVSFTDNLINDPLSCRIELVYKKPILHHIYANNYLNFPSNNIPEVKKVIFNDPATIVYWKDGTKTVVKCQKGDYFDPEKGFAMAFLKKCWGNKGNFNDKLRKIMKEAK